MKFFAFVNKILSGKQENACSNGDKDKRGIIAKKFCSFPLANTAAFHKRFINLLHSGKQKILEE